MSLGNRTSFTTGEKIVTDARYAEQLHPDMEVPEGFAVTIIAKYTNTGRVFYGGTKAEAEAHTANLDIEDYETFYVTNLNKIWIAVEVDEEGVDYKVVQ
ncbi:unnamed protein product [marine sediment metagenome]|uniref:Uncharacterized protein n=1 Tax=marine sediment metagenome TaxID=412755 RepID=X1LBM0_9ZZZZ